MRTAFCTALGLAVVIGGVPASFARDSRGSDLGKPAGTGVEAEERQHQRPGSNGGISIAVPIGRVSVGPKSLGGEPVYVRRTVREGMTIVEVSTTPFEPVLASNERAAELAVRTDQPAGW